MTAFKMKLQQGQPLIGLWQALASGYCAEICARAGFDWLLLDAEHGPNTLTTLLSQAQAIAPFPVEAITRVPYGEPVVIKQYLDMGLHTLLVPMVETAEHAAQLVQACRYPPFGIRGVASATSRGANFGSDVNYLHDANDRVTLIVQIESRAAIESLEAIAAVEGVDALFIGPGDLAASLGHIGNPMHPEVQQAIAYAKEVMDGAGKPAGIFAVSPEDAGNRIRQGFRFLSVGTDIGLLVDGASRALGLARSAGATQG